MHFKPFANIPQERDGKLPTEMLAELFQAAQNFQPATARPQEISVKQFEAHCLQQAEHTLHSIRLQKSSAPRINHIQRKPDGDGFSVAQREAGDLLEFVRSPM